MSGPGRVRRRADAWVARGCLGVATVALAAVVAWPQAAAADVLPY